MGAFNFDTISLFVLVVGFFYVVSAVSSPPPVVNIGGMFAPVDDAGMRCLPQAEHLAAFVMAINHINDKTDGIYDDLLPSTKLTFAVRGDPTLAGSMGGFLELDQSFGGVGVFSIVNALPTATALLINAVSTERKTSQIVSVANSAKLYVHSLYPYVTRSVAIQSFESIVLSNLFCTYFKARKIVTMASAQDEDIIARQQFMQLAACKYDVLADFSFTADQTEFTDQISAALATGARYFIAFMQPFQVAALLQQGHDAGLFHENTVFLTSGRGSTNITEHFSPEVDLSTLMSGFFSLSYWPNFYMNRTTEALQFASRWRSQPSTAGKSVTGMTACDDTKDDDGGFYLYRSQNSTSSSCAGIDFSLYSPSGLDIQPYTALTYDATMLMALALDVAIKSGLDYEDPVILESLQISNVSYTGPSGHIVLMAGAAATAFNSRGGRKGGNYYNVTNFNKAAYEAGRNPLVNIGYYSGDQKSLTLCVVDDVSCFAPQFSGAVDGDYSIPPSDTPPAITVHMSAGMSAVQYVMGSMIGILVLIFLVFLIANHKMKIIKSSQPVLLYSILFGGLVATVRVFIGGTNKNTALCVAEFWTGHLSFVIIIGSLFVKAYRIHYIVNTKTLRRVKFSAADAFKILFVIVLFTVLLLIFSSTYGKPQLHRKSTYQSNQETVVEFCAMLLPQFQTTLFALEFVLLSVAFWVCWKTRNVPDVVNESKVISTGNSHKCLLSI
jgi:hypothetical protein